MAEIPEGQPSPLNTNNDQLYVQQQIEAQYLSEPQQYYPQGQQIQQPYMMQYQNQIPTSQMMPQSIYYAQQPQVQIPPQQYPIQSVYYPQSVYPPSQQVQVIMIHQQQPQIVVQKPTCGYCGSTSGQYCSMEIGERAWCWCFWLTLLCFPCCFWPFIMDECKTPVSRCRSCQR